MKISEIIFDVGAATYSPESSEISLQLKFEGCLFEAVRDVGVLESGEINGFLAATQIQILSSDLLEDKTLKIRDYTIFC